MSHDPRADRTHRDKASSPLKNWKSGKNQNNGKNAQDKPDPQCARVQARLLAYLDGSVSERERQALLQHLDGCDLCRQELALYQQAEQALRGARQAAPPAGDLRPAFYARLASETAAKSSRWPQEWVWAKVNWRLAVPSLAACGVLLGWLSVPHSQRSDRTNPEGTRTEQESRIARVAPQNSDAAVPGDMLRQKPAASPASPTPSGPRIARNPVTLPPVQTGKSGQVRRIRTARRARVEIASAKIAGVRRVLAKAGTRGQSAAILVAGIERRRPSTSRDAWVQSLVPENVKRARSDTNFFAYDAEGSTRNFQAVIPPDHYASAPPHYALAQALTSSHDGMFKTQNKNMPSLNALAQEQTYGEFDAKAPRSMAAGKAASLGDSFAENAEDTGIAIQVRDSRRGFTSSMRLASQVQQRDGKQVLTIHVEDENAPSSSTETSPLLPGEVRMEPE